MRRLPVVTDPDGTVHDPECKLCSGACCRAFEEIPLTKEEHLSGRYISEETKPGVYQLAVGSNRMCPHLGFDNRCSVYNDRPQTCRVYSCRDDRRITWEMKFRPF